jgi:hypothetical protein
LLTAGADKEAKMQGGFNALCFASQGNLPVVEALLADAGADKDAITQHGYTAQGIAIQQTSKVAVAEARRVGQRRAGRGRTRGMKRRRAAEDEDAELWAGHARAAAAAQSASGWRRPSQRRPSVRPCCVGVFERILTLAQRLPQPNDALMHMGSGFSVLQPDGVLMHAVGEERRPPARASVFTCSTRESCL